MSDIFGDQAKAMDAAKAILMTALELIRDDDVIAREVALLPRVRAAVFPPGHPLRDAMKSLASWGCTDGYCDLSGPATGMHTNGGCHCLEGIRNPNIRVRLRAVLRALREGL